MKSKYNVAVTWQVQLIRWNLLGDVFILFFASLDNLILLISLEEVKKLKELIHKKNMTAVDKRKALIHCLAGLDRTTDMFPFSQY